MRYPIARQSCNGARGAGLALLAVLWPAFVSVFPLRAQEAQPLVLPPASTQSASLECQELPASTMHCQLRIVPGAAPFRSEPELAGRKVGRGTIQSAFRLGPPPLQSNNSINVPFLWDYATGRLYLDLRRDGGLANAPLFATTERPAVKLRAGMYFYQPFTNINLTFGPGPDSRPRLVDIHLYGFDGQNVLGGNLAWRSFWQGCLTLQGREWQIGLVEDPNHLGTAQDGSLVLRPWSDDSERLLLTVRVAVLGTILALALHLAGLTCRGRCGWVRLSVRLLLSVLSCWVVVLMFAEVGPLWARAKALLALVTGSFALLLPFLVLSFVNGFFRDRLRQVLRLQEPPG
jgi:hypothetical protein